MFHNVFAKLVPHTVALAKHPTSPGVQEALNPATYAIKAERVSFAVEPAVTRTVRLAFSGTREVYTGNAWDISMLLMGDTKTMPPLKDVGKWLKTLDADAVGKYTKLHGTLVSVCF